MNGFSRTSLAKCSALNFCLFAFIYAMLTSLMLQRVVLPYVFPELHAGNGLISGRDWVGFHEQAVVMAQKIQHGGWSEFMLRPDGDNAIAGVASFFYTLLGPYPWTLLPLNAVVFAIGGGALFSLIKRLDLEGNNALIALLPYVIFPSALLQFGQLHKDVFCTTSILVVLWAWVGLLHEDRKPRQIIPLIVASALALVVISVFRPYLLLPFLGFGVLLLVWYAIGTLWQAILILKKRGEKQNFTVLKPGVQSIVILMLLNALVFGLSNSYVDIRLHPVSVLDAQVTAVVPIITLRSNESVRRADASQTIYASGVSDVVESKEMKTLILKSVEECRPVVVIKDNRFFENLMDRVFIKIAVARAGFTSARGTTAATNIDEDIDFCKKDDLVRYIPRALQIAFFAPFPSNWFAVRERNSSSIEVYIASLEMLYCYIAYIGMVYWLVNYRRWQLALVVPIAFSLGLALLLGLTVANVGTLYRMRFPYVMIFASIGMAGILQFVKVKPQRHTHSAVR